MSSRVSIPDEGMDDTAMLYVCRHCTQDPRYAHLATQLMLRLTLKGLEISCGVHGFQSTAEVTDDYIVKVMADKGGES